MRHTQKQDTILYTMRHACDDMSNDTTRKAYVRGVLPFCEFLRERGINYASRLPDAREGRIELVQAFSDRLVADGKRPDTVHSYIAGVCHALGNVTHDHISLREIDTPRRGRSIKGRDPFAHNRQGRVESVKADNSRLMELAGAIGIRRSEYARLDGRSYRPDESGYMCVWVRGKGGKIQAQRILPWNVPTVAGAFAGVVGKEKLFDRSALRNHIDLHSVRRQVAQRAYEHYRYRLQTEPEYRDQLRRELIARYDSMHPSGHKNDEANRARFLREISGYGGEYVCRGETARALKARGRDVSFDRLALMATSVFHLSHWRSDVTVRNYMI